MQLKFLLYLTASAITFTSARSTVDTVNDFTSNILALNSKGASLHRGIDAVSHDASIGDLFALQNQVSEVIAHANAMTDSLRAIPGRLSVEQYNRVINGFEQTQSIIELASESIISKKPLLDVLPSGFGRVPAIVGLAIYELKGSRDGMKNAFLAVVPDNCLADAHGLAEKWGDVWNDALAAYT